MQSESGRKVVAPEGKLTITAPLTTIPVGGNQDKGREGSDATEEDVEIEETEGTTEMIKEKAKKAVKKHKDGKRKGTSSKRGGKASKGIT